MLLPSFASSSVVRKQLALCGALATSVTLAAAPRATHAQAEHRNVMLVSHMGAKCLNAEGGSSEGARLVGFPCGPGGSNEIFWFGTNGTITQGSLCLDDAGGQGKEGDQVILYHCTGARNQQWHYTGNGEIEGVNGLCIDLAGGGSVWYSVNPIIGGRGFNNQPAILYRCSGADNQRWYKGAPVSKQDVASIAPQVHVAQPKALGGLTASQVIGAGAGNVIGAGAGNVIAAGAHNFRVTGGSVIAAGAYNFIVLGGS